MPISIPSTSHHHFFSTNIIQANDLLPPDHPQSHKIHHNHIDNLIDKNTIKNEGFF